MAQKTKVLLVACVALVLFGSGYIAGCGVNSRGVPALENRLARAESLNSELQSENSRALSRVADMAGQLAGLRARASTAREVLSDAELDATRAADTAERAIRRLERLECAVSILLEAFPR